VRPPSLLHALPLGFILAISCTRADPEPAATKGTPPTAPAIQGEAQPAETTQASETVNLRGVPVRGATHREEMTFEATDALLTMKMAGLALTGTMSMKSQTTDDFEIIDVGEGEARKGRLSHVLDKETMSMRFVLPDGSEEAETLEENGVLHGRVESLESIGGSWKRTLEGAPPTPVQARLLSTEPFGEQAYPTAIRVGESWTTRGPELRRWVGSDALSISGEVKNTLLTVDLVDGEKVATIESMGEIEATMLDEDNSEVTVNLGIKGTTRRSLDRAIDIDSSFEGSMKYSGEMVVEGAPVSMTITGRFTGKLQGSLR